MHKSVDLILDIPTGSGYIWPQEMHDTLILATYFPYINRFPWELQGGFLLVGLGRHMLGVLKFDHSLVRDLLSQIFQKNRGMDALSFIKLRKLLLRRPRSCVSSN